MKSDQKFYEKAVSAVADPYRMSILQELSKKGEIRCCDVVGLTGLSQPTCSHHIKLLADSELIACRKQGRNRALLASAASLYPNVPVDTIAISYDNTRGESSRPISPCGMCRQALVEYEERVKQPIRLILSGLNGKVFIIEKANALLPLSFGSVDLK